MLRRIQRIEAVVVCKRCGRKAQVASIEDEVCLSCLANAERKRKVLGKLISRIVSDATKKVLPGVPSP